MRVGLVTPYSWTVPGGVNHHVEHLAAELESRGHEAWILAPVGAVAGRSVDSLRHLAAERFIPMGTAIPIPTNGSRAYINVSPRTIARIDRAVRYGRFDVLHVHEPCTPMVALFSVLMAASPVVGTFHAALDKSRGYDDWAWLSRMVVNRLDVKIAVSEAARVFPASRFPGDYRIVPNGVPVERFEECHRGTKVKGRILFIGRAEPRKGLSVLLAAFARLRPRLPGASLVIAGATQRQVLEASRLGPGAPAELAGVKALGWVKDDEKLAQLSRAEVVCAPSLAAESFGIVLTEAMAAGVPVVASDLPGYRSVLLDGEAGRLVKPNDPDALAAALAGLLQDAGERARLATAGLAAAKELSWVHVTDSVLAAYQDALDQPQRRGTHGLPGRPWFGRALVEYAVWASLHGRDGTRGPEAPGGGPDRA